MAKIVRTITYEGTEAQLQQQMCNSLPVGLSQWGKSVTMTIAHVEGPRFPDEYARRKLVDRQLGTEREEVN
jgi:hypothetical protein